MKDLIRYLIFSVTVMTGIMCAFSGLAENQDKTDEAEALRQEYIAKHMILENIGVSGKERSILGEVRNNGDKPIGVLQITVYFLDANGKRMDERRYTVVSTLSLMTPTAPLQPGESKSFDYFVEDYAPEGWAGKVEARISNIRFEGDVE